MPIEPPPLPNNGSLPLFPPLFTTAAIGVATFISGPVAATILIGTNFSRMGNIQMRNKTFCYGAIVTILLLWALVSIPERVFDTIPSLLGPAIFTPAAIFLADRFQGKAIKKNLERGAKKGSGLAVFGVAISAFIITFLPLILIFQVFTPFKGSEYHYSHIGHVIYYEGGVPESSLNRFGETLEEWEYFTDDFPSMAHVKYDADGLTLTVALHREFWETVDNHAELELLNSILKRKQLINVKINLVDEDYKQIETSD